MTGDEDGSEVADEVLTFVGEGVEEGVGLVDGVLVGLREGLMVVGVFVGGTLG